MCEETDKIERVSTEMRIETANIRSLMTIYSFEMDILTTIWDNNEALMFFKDNKNNIIKVNKTFAHYCGLPKEEIEGKNVLELTKNHQLAAKYAGNDSKVFETGEPIYGILEKLFDTDLNLRTDKLPIKKEGIVIGLWGYSIILKD